MVSNQTKLPSCIFGTRGGHSHRCRSHSCDRGQEAVKGFLVSVKRSRTIFKLRNSGQDVYVLCVRIAHSVVKCVRSNGQGRACGAVKWSSNQNNGQNFLALVAAVTTAPMGVWYVQAYFFILPINATVCYLFIKILPPCLYTQSFGHVGALGLKAIKISVCG